MVHAHQGDKVVPPVRPEDGKGLPVDVRVPQPPGLDDGPDPGALRLQLALQHPGGTPLGHLRQALGGEAVVVPHPAHISKLILLRTVQYSRHPT